MSTRLDPASVAGVETPAYVYDLDEVDRSLALLRAALPEPSSLFYSLKANPHPAVVSLLSSRGCGAEVCSPGELRVAREAGISASQVLYTGPGKRDAELAGAVTSGVSWFSVDSPRALGQLERAAFRHRRRLRCLLRINDWVPAAGQGLTMTGVASQFGADAQWVADDPGQFRTHGPARLAGFHLYMGSNLQDEEALLAQFETAIRTAQRLARVLGLRDMELLNLGGGFGAPFARPGELPELPNLAANLSALLDDAFPRWQAGRPAIAFESGRFLTATCGSLLTRVVDVKASHGQPVVILESGINHLGGMSGLRRLPPLVPHPQTVACPEEGQGRQEQLANAIIAGPLCTPLDTWARGASLPAVSPGDVLRVPNVGAYGLQASLVAFLGHPLPREVVLQGGVITDVSQLMLQRREPVSMEGKEHRGC